MDGNVSYLMLAVFASEPACRCAGLSMDKYGLQKFWRNVRLFSLAPSDKIAMARAYHLRFSQTIIPCLSLLILLFFSYRRGFSISSPTMRI